MNKQIIEIYELTRKEMIANISLFIIDLANTIAARLSKTDDDNEKDSIIREVNMLLKLSGDINKLRD